MYGDVLASKVLIHNAKEFATYGDIKLNIAVFYIDKSDVPDIDVTNAIYIKGTSNVHHVERNDKAITFYENSNYKIKNAQKLL